MARPHNGLALVSVVFSLAFAVWTSTRSPLVAPALHTPVLALSAAKDTDGIILTNREVEVIRDCVVTMHAPSGDGELVASLRELGSMRTARVPWDRFRGRAGAIVPANLGQRAQSFTVDCGSHRGTRVGVNMAF